MAVRRCKGLAPYLRLLATAVVLGVLVSRLHLSTLLYYGRRAPAPVLMAALVVTLSGFALSVVRWQRVLIAMGQRVAVLKLARLYLAATFVSSLLPSTVGGDVVRVRRLGRIQKERAGAVASVILERLTGWLVLPVLTLAALVANPSLLMLGSVSRLALGVALGTLVCLALIVLVASSSRLGGRLAERGDKAAGVAAAVHVALTRLRRKPGAALEVLLVSFAYQLAVALAAFLVAYSMGLGLGWTAIMAFTPVVAMIQVLPLTIGGLGLREGALVLVLHPLGVTTSQAIAFGLLVYALNLVVGLMGAPAFASLEREARAAEVVAPIPAATEAGCRP